MIQRFTPFLSSKKSDRWVLSPKQNIDLIPSSTQGPSWGRRSRNNARTGRWGERCYLQNLTQQPRSWSHSRCDRHLFWACTRLSLSKVNQRPRTVYHAILPRWIDGYWWILGGWSAIVFSYVPMSKPSRLQWTALNPWSDGIPVVINPNKKTLMWQVAI